MPLVIRVAPGVPCANFLLICINLHKNKGFIAFIHSFIHSSVLWMQFLVESLHSRHDLALRSTPDQGTESAHQRELALDILAQIAHAFDFPDLYRFLTVRHTHTHWGVIVAGGCIIVQVFLSMYISA